MSDVAFMEVIYVCITPRSVVHRVANARGVLHVVGCIELLKDERERSVVAAHSRNWRLKVEEALFLNGGGYLCGESHGLWGLVADYHTSSLPY